MTTMRQGRNMYGWMEDLFPICRSLTGNGVRETLQFFAQKLPGLAIHEVPSGTTCFDWTVPNEWNVRDAYVADESGARIIDFKAHNLHLVGYSEPIDRTMGLEELDQHLYSLPDQPNAIPYVTSYYKRSWGFCLTHQQRQKLTPQTYRVVIDSTLEPGHMTYGELFIPGKSEKTVLLSTYVCHPSMANNELSGPVLLAALGQWLAEADREYSYQLLLVPETIGTIYYLSRNLERLKKNVVAGYVLSCVGDDRTCSYLPTRNGNTLADRVMLHVLGNCYPGFTRYTFLDRASDERQYNSPGVDLPVLPFARSLYRKYPEYHTSLDDMTVVSPEGLQGSFEIIRNCIEIIEQNRTYRVTCLCEPQLGKRGLYPTTSMKGGYDDFVTIAIDFIAHCDGTLDLLQIAERIGVPADRCTSVAKRLADAGVLEAIA